MLRLYDQKLDIRFPLATRSAREMRAMPAYRVLFEGTSVIDVSEEGITSGFGLLSDYKSRFGVTEADPERALALVIEAQEKAARVQAEGAEEAAARRCREQGEPVAPAVRVDMQIGAPDQGNRSRHLPAVFSG